MGQPLDAEAAAVPSIGRRQVVLVDGRTFAISDEAGQMDAGTHGMVHDDLRHLSRFDLAVGQAQLDVLACNSPTPLSAVVVARLVSSTDLTVRAVLTRRRWIAGGLREDVSIHNTSPLAQRWTLHVRLAADFAHVFDVKAGSSGIEQTPTPTEGGWQIRDPGTDATTEVRVTPAT